MYLNFHNNFLLNHLLYIYLLIVLFYAKVKIDKKKIFAIFIHLQMMRDKIQSELDTWNKKSFASMNRKAILANNFEYINIKHI